ncbi:hypothetical protein FACS1894216_17570 [Synergistales bacterium]|nr:hypothetical protein FACS1894216_17570 [Synergistales bacterium]
MIETEQPTEFEPEPEAAWPVEAEPEIEKQRDELGEDESFRLTDETARDFQFDDPHETEVSDDLSEEELASLASLKLYDEQAAQEEEPTVQDEEPLYREEPPSEDTNDIIIEENPEDNSSLDNSSLTEDLPEPEETPEEGYAQEEPSIGEISSADEPARQDDAPREETSPEEQPLAETFTDELSSAETLPDEPPPDEILPDEPLSAEPPVDLEEGQSKEPQPEEIDEQAEEETADNAPEEIETEPSAAEIEPGTEEEGPEEPDQEAKLDDLPKGELDEGISPSEPFELTNETLNDFQFDAPDADVDAAAEENTEETSEEPNGSLAEEPLAEDFPPAEEPLNDERESADDSSPAEEISEQEDALSGETILPDEPVPDDETPDETEEEREIPQEPEDEPADIEPGEEPEEIPEIEPEDESSPLPDEITPNEEDAAPAEEIPAEGEEPQTDEGSSEQRDDEPQEAISLDKPLPDEKPDEPSSQEDEPPQEEELPLPDDEPSQLGEEPEQDSELPLGDEAPAQEEPSDQEEGAAVGESGESAEDTVPQQKAERLFPLSPTTRRRVIAASLVLIFAILGTIAYAWLSHKPAVQVRIDDTADKTALSSDVKQKLSPSDMIPSVELIARAVVAYDSVVLYRSPKTGAQAGKVCNRGDIFLVERIPVKGAGALFHKTLFTEDKFGRLRVTATHYLDAESVLIEPLSDNERAEVDIFKKGRPPRLKVGDNLSQEVSGMSIYVTQSPLTMWTAPNDSAAAKELPQGTGILADKSSDYVPGTYQNMDNELWVPIINGATSRILGWVRQGDWKKAAKQLIDVPQVSPDAQSPDKKMDGGVKKPQAAGKTAEKDKKTKSSEADAAVIKTASDAEKYLSETSPSLRRDIASGYFERRLAFNNRGLVQVYEQAVDANPRGEAVPLNPAAGLTGYIVEIRNRSNWNLEEIYLVTKDAHVFGRMTIEDGSGVWVRLDVNWK